MPSSTPCNHNVLFMLYLQFYFLTLAKNDHQHLYPRYYSFEVQLKKQRLVCLKSKMPQTSQKYLFET